MQRTPSSAEMGTWDWDMASAAMQAKMLLGLAAPIAWRSHPSQVCRDSSRSSSNRSRTGRTGTTILRCRSSLISSVINTIPRSVLRAWFTNQADISRYSCKPKFRHLYSCSSFKKMLAPGRIALGVAFDIIGICVHLRGDPTQHRCRDSFLRRPRPPRMAQKAQLYRYPKPVAIGLCAPMNSKSLGVKL
jgi:hypothetical protein